MSIYEIGTVVFDHWIIEKRLGIGSFGRVYEIRREDFGETYYAALKVITVPQSEDELRSAMEEGMSYTQAKEYFYGVVEDVVREFSLMSKLKGTANVVNYMDHLVIPHEDGIGWDILIRMELLTPVLTYAYQHPMSRRDVIRLGIDMCRALELCQKYNIIHRDIKPENIFVSENGDFKLGDFGIARTIENTMSGLSQKGTYSYMAPEIYHGEEYGYSVDIYSLGIVLYRLLNKNRIPFLPPAPEPITHRDRENALARRMGGETVSKPFYSEGRLSEIVLKACAYDPKERYSSPAQMRQELEAILYDQSESELIYPDGDTLAISENNYWSTSGGNYKSERKSAVDDQHTIKTAERVAQPEERSAGSRTDVVVSKMERWKAVLCAVLVALAFAAIGGGIVLCMRSQHLKQFQSLMEKGNAICDTDPEVAIDLFTRAQSLYPKEPAPYIAHAYALYSAGDYTNCISYIEDELALGKTFDVEKQSQLSEILGAAYFEQGDYTEAASFFRLSTAGGDLTVPAMRDYAVSLGRIGDIEAADEVLQRMYDAGAEGDVTDYVQGEVDYALGNYVSAEKNFLGVLDSTDDSLLERRCVRSLGEVYRDCSAMEAQGSLSPITQPAEKSVQLLSGAMVKYGLDYDSVLWEMLAKSYYDAYNNEGSGSSDYLEKAAQAFQRVIDLGIKKDYLYSNLFSVYYEMKDYEMAGTALDAFEEQFPQLYTPHALRSMLLITAEGDKPQEERDYQAAIDEFVLAGKMIQGDDDATYYQQLEGYIEQLYETGNADAGAVIEANAEDAIDAEAEAAENIQVGGESVPAP